MLNRIINFSIHNKLAVGFFTVILIAWGCYSLTQLPIDALPDITNNQVQVVTVSSALSGEDIERMLTFPVEQTMSTIPDVDEIRSFSRFGLSVVTIVFKEHVDVYWARQQVSERLSSLRSQIPAGLGQPELAPLTTGLSEIYQYTVRAKPGFESRYSPMDLRTIQDWIIRRQLLGVEGVADVSSFGGQLKQYEVSLDPDRLKSLHIDIHDVLMALEKNNQNTGGSYIDNNPKVYFIRSEGIVRTLEDISNIVIKVDSNGIPLLIRDVGKVGWGYATRYGAVTYNDQGEVVGAIVLMLKGANSSKVIARVKDRMEEITKTLPAGVMVEAFLDRTKLVNNAINTVATNLAEGALIVIFVLVIFLGNFRAGLVVASVIPLSMLFAISMMSLFGVSGNLMSLGAIDFGLIVDGTLIIVEATMHHLGLREVNSRLTQNEMDEEVKSAASRMMKSAAFGEIIILIVYLPILALAGVEGKMFRPMAQTVAFAILGAFILSLTYVPMISATFLSKEPLAQSKLSLRLMNVLQRIYDPAIRWTLHNKLKVIAAAVVLFVGSIFVFQRLGAEFIPTLEEGDFAVETRLLPGTSLTKTVDVMGQAAKILKEEFPEVKAAVGKVGNSEIPIDPMPMEWADLIVVLKDRDEWTSAEDREELAEKMKARLDRELAGVTFGFQQPIQMRFNELLTGVRQDVAIKVYGEDLEQLKKYADEIGHIIGNVDGVQDLYVEKNVGPQQLVVDYDRQRLARFGVSVEEVNQVVRASFAGEPAGVVYEGEKRFDIVVRLDSTHRASLENISNVYVSTPAGEQVPISQLATIGLKVSPHQIQREDTHRRIVIGFNVRGRDVESIINEIDKKISSQIRLAPGYSIHYGGTFEQLQEAMSRLYIAVPAALFLIFVLLYFTFHSAKQSLLIFMAIPFSAIGGIAALWIRGMPFSISAGIGFIALFGVAVLNGIVMVGEFNHLKKEGLTDIDDIVLKGTSTRLRPVILTALVASLGFLPMALSQSSGAEVQRPLATVVIGGLISATLLTLLVLPSLFIYFERKMSINKHVSIFVLLMLGSVVAMAQSQPTISPEQAVELALKNNRSIAAARSDLEAKRADRQTSGDIGKTQVLGTFGQYNGYPTNDNNITITQSLPFPTVFGARRALGSAHVESGQLMLATEQNNVRYSVLSTWYQLNYLLALNRRLMKEDSILSAYAKTSGSRQAAGEITVLEKLTAEGRSQKLKATLRQNEAEVFIYQSRLQALTGSSTFLDVTSTPQMRELLLADSLNAARSPRLRLHQQQAVIAAKETSLRRNSLLPDLTLGYFNQTLIGVPLRAGSTELSTATNRFQGFQVGLALPIWLRPQVKKIKAAQYATEALTNSYQQDVLATQAEVNGLVDEVRKYRESLEYYNTAGLQQARTIDEQSLKSYRAGETGMAELLLALQTANELHLGYLDTLNKLNQAILRLEYLTQQ